MMWSLKNWENKLEVKSQESNKKKKLDHSPEQPKLENRFLLAGLSYDTTPDEITQFFAFAGIIPSLSTILLSLYSSLILHLLGVPLKIEMMKRIDGQLSGIF